MTGYRREECCSLGEVYVCDGRAAFCDGLDAAIRDADAAAQVESDEAVT